MIRFSILSCLVLLTLLSSRAVGQDENRNFFLPCFVLAGGRTGRQDRPVLCSSLNPTGPEVWNPIPTQVQGLEPDTRPEK